MRFTGFHAQGEDEREPPLDLTRLLVRHPNATIYARMAGEAMSGEQIHDGDLLVIEAAEHYASGQIVLVFVDGVEIVRRFERQQDRIVLHSTHPDFPTLELSDTDENWLIRGRVLASITLHAPPRFPLPVVS